MTYFVLQTAALLLAVYLIGTALGCMLRSLFHDIEDAARTRVHGREPVQGDISSGAVAPARPTVRTGVSGENVAGGAAAMASAAVASAATSQSTHRSPPPITPRRHPPYPGEVPFPEQRVYVASGTSDSVDQPPAASEIASVVPEDVSFPEQTGYLVDPDDAVVVKSPPPVSAEPVVPEAPDATGQTSKVSIEPSAVAAASGAAVASAGAVAAAQRMAGEGGESVMAAAAASDDLKRIRGIGADVEARLHASGIQEYRQIANWSAADIDRFSVELNAGDRISRENWIEQAQMLSSGGLTDYARRIDRGEVPVDYSYGTNDAADDDEARAGDEPSGGVRESLAAVTATGAAAAAVAPGEMAAENRERALRSARSGETSDWDKRQQGESSGDGERREPREPRAPQEATEPSDDRPPREPRVSTDNRDSALRSVRSEALIERGAQEERPPRLRSTDAVDDLKQIKGVGVTLEKKLNAAGITSFEQIARWNSRDIAEMNKLLSFSGRIERENWIEQAHILARGGQTDFSRRVTRGEVQSSRDDD